MNYNDDHGEYSHNVDPDAIVIDSDSDNGDDQGDGMDVNESDNDQSDDQSDDQGNVQGNVQGDASGINIHEQCKSSSIYIHIHLILTLIHMLQSLGLFFELLSSPAKNRMTGILQTIMNMQNSTVGQLTTCQISFIGSIR